MRVHIVDPPVLYQHLSHPPLSFESAAYLAYVRDHARESSFTQDDPFPLQRIQSSVSFGGYAAPLVKPLRSAVLAAGSDATQYHVIVRILADPLTSFASSDDALQARFKSNWFRCDEACGHVVFSKGFKRAVSIGISSFEDSDVCGRLFGLGTYGTKPCRFSTSERFGDEISCLEDVLEVFVDSFLPGSTHTANPPLDTYLYCGP